MIVEYRDLLEHARKASLRYSEIYMMVVNYVPEISLYAKSLLSDYIERDLSNHSELVKEGVKLEIRGGLVIDHGLKYADAIYELNKKFGIGMHITFGTDNYKIYRRV